MNISPAVWFPAGRFFSDGRLTFALILVLLQATIILWPLAISMGRRHVERMGVERLLAELADTHRPSSDAGLPLKTFRKAA